MKFYCLLVLFTGLIIYTLAYPDLPSTCPETIAEDGKLLLNAQSTPYGNLTAGIYKKNSAETLTECIQACCDDNSCNVAFLFNRTCFTIQCHSYELCKPLKRTGKKFDNSVLVIVRLPDPKYYDDFSDNDAGKSFPNIFYHDDSEEDLDKDTILSNLDSSSTTGFFPIPPKHCIYGLGNDCPAHESCRPKNQRARTGLCHCEENYERDVQGICKRKIRSSLTYSQHITLAPSTSSAMNVQNKSNGEKSVSTTVSPVHQLVVSAGDNVTLQLPENEVTLSAYALKQQDGESDGYKYEWTLISHPEGDDETGTMQDQNTKNLKLSKLRAGLYTFKVTVSSANAVGEAMVNVTVLPPERENKPPVAIIQPSNVTVKLPNKDTVLDGSSALSPPSTPKLWTYRNLLQLKTN